MSDPSRPRPHPRPTTVRSRAARPRAVRLHAGVFIAAALGALVLCACASDPKDGYAWTSSYDRDIRTVAVPIFQNPTFTRGIETELTDAVIKEIQSQTPWRVAQGGEAQTELSGALVDSRLRSLSTNRDTGLVQELDTEITVDFSFKDRRTGKVIVARKNFTAAESFDPSRPVGERLEAGQHAVVQRLARDIVAELRSTW